MLCIQLANGRWQLTKKIQIVDILVNVHLGVRISSAWGSCVALLDWNDIMQCFFVHTLWVITCQNGSLFSETLGTERGRPDWTQADSDSMGERLLVCKCHRALTWWKESQICFFIEQKCKCSLRVCVWFTSAYLVMVINMIMPDVACRMQYTALSGAIQGLYLRACFPTVHCTKRSLQ